MAFSAKSLLLVSILLSSLFIPEASECNTRNGCFYAKESASSFLEVHSTNRKLLYGLERGLKVDLKHDGPTSTSSSKSNSNIGNSINEEGNHINKYIVDGELRRVPSGPDPLHHNGGSPKKPKTTP